MKKYRYEKLLNGEQSFITCSRTCQNILIGKEHRGENNINYKQPYSIVCNICEKLFEVPPNRKDKAKYCSKQCQRIGVGKQNIPTKVHIIECDNCSKKVTRWEHQLMKYEYHFCSSECRQSYQGIFLSNRTNKLETSCQIKTNKMLKIMNIEFENEKPYKFYAVDNFLIKSNLIIEVMGDYWHSNPTKYSSYGFSMILN